MCVYSILEDDPSKLNCGFHAASADHDAPKPTIAAICNSVKLLDIGIMRNLIVYVLYQNVY